MESSNPTKIAVIGGGASGVAVCHELYQNIRTAFPNGNGNAKIEVTVFEKGPVIGPGYAYSSPYDSHTVHFPIRLLKAAFDSDETEGNSAPQKGDDHENHTPRHKFGEFLSDIAIKTQKDATKFGVTIEFRCETEVLDVIKTNDDKIQVKTSTGEYTANFVVFCTGHLPAKAYRELIGRKGYWHDAYCPKSEMKEFDYKKDVAIIGTRLSAQDVILRLFVEENFQANATMISTDGMLNVIFPKDCYDHQLKYLCVNSAEQPISLEYLMSLFWKEISEAQGIDIQFSNVQKSYKEVGALTWLNRQIRENETQPKPWQMVIFAITKVFPHLFSSLSSADQEEFRKKYFGLLITYGAAMPEDSAKLLKNLIEQGRLNVRGGLKSIKTNNDDEFVLECEDGENIVTKQIINATGNGFDVNDLPMFKKMGERGEIVAHEGGGVKVNPNTFKIITRNGEENPRMFAIGAPTFGVVVVTADIRVIAWQAKTVTSSILRTIT